MDDLELSDIVEFKRIAVVSSQIQEYSLPEDFETGKGYEIDALNAPSSSEGQHQLNQQQQLQKQKQDVQWGKILSDTDFVLHGCIYCTNNGGCHGSPFTTSEEYETHIILKASLLIPGKRTLNYMV